MANSGGGDRPQREDRVSHTRTAPAVISIRTRFIYDTNGDKPGQPPRVVRYHSDLTDGGEFSSHAAQYNHVGDVFQRMLAAFGDDADLEVVVRRTSRTLAATAPAVQKGREIPHDGTRNSEVKKLR